MSNSRLSCVIDCSGVRISLIELCLFVSRAFGRLFVYFFHEIELRFGLLKVCVVKSTCQWINENSQLYMQFLGLKFFLKNDCIGWLQASEEPRIRIFLVLCRISKSILVSRKTEFDQTFYSGEDRWWTNRTSTKLRSDKCPVRKLTANLSHLKNLESSGISRRRYSGLQGQKLNIDDLVKWLPITITLYVIECMIILNTTC
jgi:hypothetical protein